MTIRIIDSGNNDLTKKTLILNGAGSSLSNPILKGLGLSFNLRFFNREEKVKATEDIVSPALKTDLPLTQGVVDTLLFFHEMAAGDRVFDKKAFIRFELIDSFSGEVNVVEKQLFVASLPDDAVQVLDKNGNWISVNIDRFPAAIPTVSTQCPVRFFDSWKDEFEIKTFGGSEFVSAFDTGGLELVRGDDQDVIHEEQKTIKYFHRIQLIKSHPLLEDTHNITFRFRSLKNSERSVDVNIRVKTAACYSTKNPITSENFPIYFGE